MENEELRELQDPATWDDESDVVLPAATSPRVTVQVTFDEPEFARIATNARRHQMTASAVIRAVVLGTLTPEGNVSPSDSSEPTGQDNARREHVAATGSKRPTDAPSLSTVGRKRA